MQEPGAQPQMQAGNQLWIFSTKCPNWWAYMQIRKLGVTRHPRFPGKIPIYARRTGIIFNNAPLPLSNAFLFGQYIMCSSQSLQVRLSASGKLSVIGLQLLDWSPKARLQPFDKQAKGSIRFRQDRSWKKECEVKQISKTRSPN